MIVSFKSKPLKLFFIKGDTAKLPAEDIERIRDRLSMLNAAAKVGDVNVPGWHFHPLKGNRKNEYAVEVRGNWRIVFRFDEGDAYDVDYIDYHKKNMK